MSSDQIKDVLIKYSQLGKTDKAAYHSYEFFYPTELQYLSAKPQNTLNILEVGTAFGGSLRCWMELYPAAHFYAIDHTPEVIEADALPGVSFDLIIDDGSHQSVDQIATFAMLESRLAYGGKYMIEDIYPENVYPPEFKNTFRVVDLSAIKKRGDDVVFVYEKNVLKNTVP
jgi:hypothetical protein